MSTSKAAGTSEPWRPGDATTVAIESGNRLKRFVLDAEGRFLAIVFATTDKMSDLDANVRLLCGAPRVARALAALLEASEAPDLGSKVDAIMMPALRRLEKAEAEARVALRLATEGGA